MLKNEVASAEIDRIEFETLSVGDTLAITTGIGDEAWEYYFTVDEKTRLWPRGRLDARSPNGDEIGEITFELHGCGRWTTPQQNPVQKQLGKAFTPYYEGVSIGAFLFGKLSDETDRARFDKEGQEISQILVFKAKPAK